MVLFILMLFSWLISFSGSAIAAIWMMDHWASPVMIVFFALFNILWVLSFMWLVTFATDTDED
jgi:hypothetical protein